MVSARSRRLLSPLLLFGILGLPGQAIAHDAPTGWKYPWACCSSIDCKEVQSSVVLEKPEGYVIQSTGEVVGYQDKRVKNSPDGEYHWCAHQTGIDAGHTICLFVPPKGF
ncbi:MAG: hypothetical protein E5W55_08695 [Mesorhizobium sp.]|nr:MAG: hypothetical protein E5W55_08695 [Mesorhizobium sp.]